MPDGNFAAMTTQKKTLSLTDPEVLASVSSLAVRARSIVEGTIAGMHQSPYHGFSTEFLEYRSYRTGESTKHIDWRKYAKSGRTVVRVFEDETNLQATILLDASASMTFCSGSSMSKYDYARTLAAALAMLLIRQRDAAGLFAFNDTVRLRLPSRSTDLHFRTIISKLEALEASGTTQCGAALEQIAPTLTKRGLCILISDLFDDPADIIRGLKHLRYKKQDVLVFVIADPLELSFHQSGSLKLHDLETNAEFLLDAATASRYFNDGATEHRNIIARACKDLQIDCEQCVTDEPFRKALMRMLDKRKRMT